MGAPEAGHHGEESWRGGRAGRCCGATTLSIGRAETAGLLLAAAGTVHDVRKIILTLPTTGWLLY